MLEKPKLIWDVGTAYDLFTSLHVLHYPDKFGLRASWAAGVRSRLPSESRDVLEQSQHIFGIPIPWIKNLPEPKDGDAVLWVLGQMPPEKRLVSLTIWEGECCEMDEFLLDVAARGSWDDQDKQTLRALSKEKKSHLKPKVLDSILDTWAHSKEFGERYLDALRAYQEVFFNEEETRIRPALQDAVERAQELAAKLSLAELFEELSQGIRFDKELEGDEIVLAPSYWVTPLVMFDLKGEGKGFLLFGARPPDVSLVPGEAVPDMMLRVLKTLADPTRLRIMRYLSTEPITSAELARRLRLRPPTVTHHLSSLRLAGLVYLTLGEKGERRYTSRLEAVKAAFTSLLEFLGE